MRWVCVMGLSLIAGMAGTAGARPHRPHASPAEASPGDFWRDIIEPHGEVVTAIVGKARIALGKLGESATGSDEAVEQRVRRVSDAYAMLRYARTLDPENPEVLGLLGAAADELGKTRQAVEALEACVRQAGPERAGSEVTGRLGMIYLRLGKLDDAIRWLRDAQGPLTTWDHATAAVYLATALAAHGEMPDAIDVIAHALPTPTSYSADPITLVSSALVSFALAVHYDRDDQRGAAFEVLDRMPATLQPELGPVTQRALAAMRFAPAEDQYYYRALLYEALGNYPEARAEWALYASVEGALWRRRALDHIKAIDAQRSAPPAGRPTAPASSSPRFLLRRRTVP